MNFTEIEQEVIFLKAINESIDSMVNPTIFELMEGNGGAEIKFKTSLHQRFFNIILVDFLSKPAREFIWKRNSCLDALIEICSNPNFNKYNSVKTLEYAVTTFKNWLESEIQVKVYLPSINLQTELIVSRREFIEICGDISKHNFSRLSKRVEDLQKILAKSKVTRSNEDGLLIIDDFYEKFHSDILNYLGSQLVEQLNNIRWGIQDYLQPEFKRSIIVCKDGDMRKYRYTYPSDINTEFAKNCYWDLMDEVRNAPNVKRFKTHEILKLRY